MYKYIDIIMCSCLRQNILYFDTLILENTELCEYAYVVYESCASLSLDDYLINPVTNSNI